METLSRPPGRWTALARLVALVSTVWTLSSGCDGTAGPGGAETGAAAEDGALHGVLSRYISDGEDGTSETLTFLRLPDGREERLIFDRDPRLDADTPVAVWGSPAAGGLAVARLRVEGEPPAVETRQSALVGAAPAPPRSFAFVLVDTGDGVNLTVEQARQRLFDASYFMLNQGSIRRYYQEGSFGTQDITGDVFGPIAFTPGSSCDTRGVTALRGTVDQLAGGPSNHYLWYFGSKQAGCAFAGLAAEGSPTRPQRDTWYNASSSCVVLVQEPGHNFGMQHSSAMLCPGAPFVDAPNGVCSHSEYGDPYDPMGNGCRHMNGWQKAFEGWLAGCNSVEVTRSGTFTLLPLETACDGIQLLQIPMPRTRTFSHSGGGGTSTTDTLTSYYVELREPVGFDQGVGPAVLIHVAGDYPGRTRSGLHTWLLDMTPGTSTFKDAALPAGATFTDPAGGVSITVTSVGATSASIQVTIDGAGGSAPTCLDGTTLTAPGPATCGGGLTGGADAGVIIGRPPGGAGGTDAGLPAGDAGVRGPNAASSSLMGGCACTTAPGGGAGGAPWTVLLGALAWALGATRRSARNRRAGAGRTAGSPRSGSRGSPAAYRSGRSS